MDGLLSIERTYLDFNATARLRPEAADAFAQAAQTLGNPSSVHFEGRSARARVESARDEVAGLVNAAATGVVFTSGGTEANNLVVSGVIAAEGVERLLVSAIEHPSVLEAARSTGVPVREIAVTPDGVVDFDDLGRALADDDSRALISVMLANNETGVLQPVAEVVRLAHEHDAIVHTDAVQAAGKSDTDFAALGVDAMSLSSHKIGGPQGTGALILRDGLKLRAQMHGGGQELKRRGGTENVAAIVGFGAAARCARTNIDERGELMRLRDLMEREITGQMPDATILGGAAERLVNTTCVAACGVTAEYLLIALDLAGFAVSSGSACSSGKVARSHVLGAMGIDEHMAGCAIRISLGWSTREREVRAFVETLVQTCKRKTGAAAVAAA